LVILRFKRLVIFVNNSIIKKGYEPLPNFSQ
jgi:hypothetical protein